MSWLFGSALSSTMVAPERALRGREGYPYTVPETHTVLGTPLRGPWPEGTRTITLGLGCFWGAEREFWQLPGVVSTAVGYQGGYTPHPTYEEVCTGQTGHAEVVQVAYDPTVLSDADLLRAFWEAHDPTQGFRQGNDRGTQYRSTIYPTTPEQARIAEETRATFQERLARSGYGGGGRALLLRRGLPPAVPGQEPGRLLPGALDGGRLPGAVGVVSTRWGEGRTTPPRTSAHGGEPSLHELSPRAHE
jgi:peptide-methionine (S)-S-oxide reductase